MVSTLGELNLRDEYAILEYNAVLADDAKALSPVQHSAVLIRGKKGKGHGCCNRMGVASRKENH